MSKKEWMYFGLAAAAAFVAANSLNTYPVLSSAYIGGYNLATTGQISFTTSQ